MNDHDAHEDTLCGADGLAVSISDHNTQHGISTTHTELFGIFVYPSPRIVPTVMGNYLPNRSVRIFQCHDVLDWHHQEPWFCHVSS
jgi:hypothetical protein